MKSDMTDDAAARRHRDDAVDRRAHDVLTLFTTRNELRGVHAHADLVGEYTLWSA